MVKYNNSNEKFSNSQRNKLKSGIKIWNCSNFKSFIKLKLGKSYLLRSEQNKLLKTYRTI